MASTTNSAETGAKAGTRSTADESATAAKDTTTATSGATSDEAATESPDEAATTDASAAEDQTAIAARGIIRRNMYWSMGAAVIPIQVVDMAAMLAVQLKMLRDLSNLYGVEFKANAGKSAVAALLGSAVPSVLGHTVAPRLLMGAFAATPGLGKLLTIATMPAFGAAFTYAVGKTFQRHFESGGTLLTFNAKEVEGFFKEKFKEGKDKAESESQDGPAAAPSAA